MSKGCSTERLEELREGFHPMRCHLKWCLAELRARPHTLYNAELSTPEIRMELSLLKVSGDTKSLGCKEQQKREILSWGGLGPLKMRCPNVTSSLRPAGTRAGLLGWMWMSEWKSIPAQN